MATSEPPDFVNIKITNPLTYIKYWWKKIMANEGIDLRLRVRPVTAFGIALIAFSLAFGLGGVIFPVAFPWLKINVGATPAPTIKPTSGPVWKDTALKGTLWKTTTEPVKFYLVTSSDEAVTLQTPQDLNLLSLVGKRIFVTGEYDAKNKILIVKDAQDFEILSATPQPIPTASPTPFVTATPSPTIVPTLKPHVTPTEPAEI